MLSMSRWAWDLHSTTLFTCTSAIPLPTWDTTSSLNPRLLGWHRVFPHPIRVWRKTTSSPPRNGTTVFIAQLGRESQVEYPRFRSLGMGFSSLRFAMLLLIFHFPLVMDFVSLTMICFSAVFANKRLVAPKLSLVNIASLHRVLRSEILWVKMSNCEPST